MKLSINKQYQSTKNNTTFTGIRDGKNFRRAANKLIDQARTMKAGTCNYKALKNGSDSFRTRLLNVIHEKAGTIGDAVTKEDKRLHESLKKLYKKFEEADNYMDAIAGGGGHHKEVKVDFSI